MGQILGNPLDTQVLCVCVFKETMSCVMSCFIQFGILCTKSGSFYLLHLPQHPLSLQPHTHFLLITPFSSLTTYPVLRMFQGFLAQLSLPVRKTPSETGRSGASSLRELGIRENSAPLADLLPLGCHHGIMVRLELMGPRGDVLQEPI